MTLARLVTTIAAPLDSVSADAPHVLHWPGRRLLIQRSDTELVTLDLQMPGSASMPEVRFPAPWPRRFGSATVSPEQDGAVFAGVHGVRLVEASGATRWEVEHGCWSWSCASARLTIDEYLNDDGHAHSDGGSAAFSSDGLLVWAHVLGPLSNEPDTEPEDELWVVLDAGSGSILGHAKTTTTASSSEHTPHPDPAQMGLSVAEGEEGSPALWGRWTGNELTVNHLGIERILLDVSPTGRYLLTVPVGQWSLALHGEDGAVQAKLDAAGNLPEHPMNADSGRVYWDYEAAFIDEVTIVAGTSECDARYGAVRHWIVNATDMTLHDEVTYPFPVWGPARSAGGGIWYTISKDKTAIYLWQLAEV